LIETEQAVLKLNLKSDLFKKVKELLSSPGQSDKNDQKVDLKTGRGRGRPTITLE